MHWMKPLHYQQIFLPELPETHKYIYRKYCIQKNIIYKYFKCINLFNITYIWKFINNSIISIF